MERVVSVGNREQFGAGNRGLEHVGDWPAAGRSPGTHDVEDGLTDPGRAYRSEIPVVQRVEVVLKRASGVLNSLVTNTGYVFGGMAARHPRKRYTSEKGACGWMTL